MLCVISRKENNRAKYVATGNQREFIAGNATIIFRMFFPILRIADRFCIYPRLSTRASGQRATRNVSLYMAKPMPYIYRWFLVDSCRVVAVSTWSTIALSASGYLRRIALHVEEEVSTRVIISPVTAIETSISRLRE